MIPPVYRTQTNIISFSFLPSFPHDRGFGALLVPFVSGDDRHVHCIYVRRYTISAPSSCGLGYGQLAGFLGFHPHDPSAEKASAAPPYSERGVGQRTNSSALPPRSHCNDSNYSPRSPAFLRREEERLDHVHRPSFHFNRQRLPTLRLGAHLGRSGWDHRSRWLVSISSRP